jgi:RNA polymerase sigma-70 factor (ECF subfamily)
MAPRRLSDPRADAERSFEQLYRGHRNYVYRASLRALGNSADAEDVTQAAFVDAYRAVLRGTRPQAPRAWLLMIAENVRRRRFRTSLRRPREEPLDADAALAAEESHAQASALLEALATLTTEQREAFVLREITGLSYDEIAEQMDSTVASVQMLLFRARRTLRNELEPPHAWGALFPLTTLFSRLESFSLAPRAAGAVGAAVVAVSVSAGVPPSADTAPARPAPTRHVAVGSVAAPAPVTAPVAATRPKRVSARKPVPPKRRATAKAPIRVAVIPVAGRPAPVPASVPATPVAPTPQTEPATPQPAHKPEPARTRTTSPAALPTAPVPAVVETVVEPVLETVVQPVLETVVQPVLETVVEPVVETVVDPLLGDVGAAGAAWAGALPLPVRPLDP